MHGAVQTKPEAAQFEEHRAALTGFCYRMLGSGFEAEDADATTWSGSCASRTTHVSTTA